MKVFLEAIFFGLAAAVKLLKNLKEIKLGDFVVIGSIVEIERNLVEKLQIPQDLADL